MKLLPRKDQCTIFRLRTQHIALKAHINKINPEHPPLCYLCNDPYETVDHVLFKCNQLLDLRKKFLPTQPHTQNCLYSTYEQLTRTSKYFHLALSKRLKPKRSWISKQQHQHF